jgi:HK97 family phage portal protein
MTLLADVLQRLLPARGSARPDETKRSATARLVRVEMLGEPVWSPRDYGAFAREGFMKNAILYRSVRMIAEAAASIPLLLYERGGFELEEHPLLDLMRCPSHDQTGTDFLESWYGYLLVAGNAYVEAVALDGQVRELHALRPDRMKVIPGPDGWPSGYEYTADGRSVTFEHEPVPGVRPILHMRLFHPVNDHYGLSPIEAAATAIDIHNAASSWNKALLDNAARPSGALVYGKGGEHMTADQFDRLKGELEASFQGAKNAGRPLLLEGGLDWKPLSLTPKDMDFIEARNMAAREIALALGVPPMLLGIPGDNTYSNYQEAQRAFWRQTVLPLVTRTCRSLSAWLSPAFLPMSASGNGSGGLELRPDLDQIDALSSERDALWTRLEKATFLTANEKRVEAGYDPITGGDELKFRADALPALRMPTPHPRQDAPKFNPGQPRVPAGNPDGGQWTNADGSQDAGDGGDGAPYGTTPDGTPVDEANRRVSRTPPTSGQAVRLDNAVREARVAIQQVQERDPTWRPTQQLTNPDNTEGYIAAHEAVAAEARARLNELLRDAIPNTNPDWGVNRLRKELNDRGFVFETPTDAPGLLYRNQATGEQVRIMERPAGEPRRSDPVQKYLNAYYYRYQPGDDMRWGTHITIPNKN